MGPRKANILCISRSFGHFPTITDYFKISEVYPKLMKMSEDYRRLPTTTPKLFDFIFVIIFTWERNVFGSSGFDFFQETK